MFLIRTRSSQYRLFNNLRRRQEGAWFNVLGRRSQHPLESQCGRSGKATTPTCSRMRGSFSYGPYNACVAPLGLISLMIQPCQTRRHASDRALSFLNQGRADMTVPGNETGCTRLAHDQVFIGTAPLALEAPKRRKPRASLDIKLDDAHDGVSHTTAVRGRG